MLPCLVPVTLLVPRSCEQPPCVVVSVVAIGHPAEFYLPQVCIWRLRLTSRAGGYASWSVTPHDLSSYSLPCVISAKVDGVIKAGPGALIGRARQGAATLVESLAVAFLALPLDVRRLLRRWLVEGCRLVEAKSRASWQL